MKELSIEAKAYDGAISIVNDMRIYPNRKDFVKL